MRIRLLDLWSRPGVNLAKGTVLDTEAEHGIFRCTRAEAESLLRKKKAEPVDEPAAAEVPADPHEAALAEAMTPVHRKRGNWKTD